PKFLLPAGNLRDTFNQRRRADIIVISKSPQLLTDGERQEALKRVNVSSSQNVLFSYLNYGQPYWLSSDKQGGHNKVPNLDQDQVVLLVTGIANPESLFNYLQTQVNQVYLL